MGAIYRRRCKTLLVWFRQRLPVDFPVRRQRESLQRYKHGRHHVLGQLSAQMLPNVFSRQRDPLALNNVGHQSLPARPVRVPCNNRLYHVRMPRQHRLNLAKLHTIAPELHLKIHSPQADEVAVRPIFRQVPRAIQPGFRLERMRDELLRRQFGAIQVATGQTSPTDQQLSDDADGHELKVRVEDVDLGVVYRAPDVNIPLGVDPAAG